jgi:hypothetical protein
VIIFLRTPPLTAFHLAGVHHATVQVNTFNLSYFHNARCSKYQIESSFTIHSNEILEKFFVVNDHATSSITPYQESSVAVSVVGFNTHAVLDSQTLGATAVHLVASIPNQIQLCLPMNASAILL